MRLADGGAIASGGSVSSHTRRVDKESDVDVLVHDGMKRKYYTCEYTFSTRDENEIGTRLNVFGTFKFRTRSRLTKCPGEWKRHRCTGLRLPVCLFLQ